MSLALDYHHGAEAGREHVLAMRWLRRSVERGQTRSLAARRTPMALSAGELTRELEELVAALDRRMPRVEQAGELAIARDAAALRAKALGRLSELTGGPDAADAGVTADAED
jgi:hypothetical protein